MKTSSQYLDWRPILLPPNPPNSSTMNFVPEPTWLCPPQAETRQSVPASWELLENEPFQVPQHLRTRRGGIISSAALDNLLLVDFQGHFSKSFFMHFLKLPCELK